LAAGYEPHIDLVFGVDPGKTARHASCGQQMVNVSATQLRCEHTGGIKMKKILALMAGLGIGATLMYLFDPKGGNRRRALIRDQGISLKTKTQKAVRGKIADLKNRSQGLLHETKNAFDKGRQRAQQEMSRDIVH
jgi:hypothetical protein